MSSTFLRHFYPQIFIPNYCACWTDGVYHVNDVKIQLGSDMTKHKVKAKAPLPWQQKPAGLFIHLLQGCRGHTLISYTSVYTKLYIFVTLRS